MLCKQAILGIAGFIVAATAWPDAPNPQAVVDGIFAPVAGSATPGCAVGVFQDGEMMLQRNYGVANVDSETPLSGDTLFYMASMSKQFTALAAIKLVEDGKLRLQDDVHKWLPELPDYGAPVTASHGHDVGLRNRTRLAMA